MQDTWIISGVSGFQVKHMCGKKTWTFGLFHIFEWSQMILGCFVDRWSVLEKANSLRPETVNVAKADELFYKFWTSVFLQSFSFEFNFFHTFRFVLGGTEVYCMPKKKMAKGKQIDAIFVRLKFFNKSEHFTQVFN